MDTFARLHHAGEPLLLPNAWDFASAAAFVRAGFRAVGTTSLGVAAAHDSLTQPASPERKPWLWQAHWFASRFR